MKPFPSAPWNYAAGQIVGTPRPHDGDDKEHGTRHPSEIVAKIPVCDFGDYIYYPREIADQHGKLIAAAPTHLTALESILTQADGDLTDDKFRAYARLIAENAIAKMKGTQ